MFNLKDDTILVAGLIGVISTVVAEVVTQIFKLIGVTKNSLFELSSMVITLNRPTIVIGLFVSASVGGFLSILLYFAFEKFGSQHLIMKCIGISIIMWVALEMVFTFSIEARLIRERPISAYYGHLVGAIIFGIAEGILFRRYLFIEYTQRIGK
ncbi:hypothetical protein HMPREF1982_02944 [Clostridiales bacterium oral taxon 876 str. F0540]|nr:hypothetical protein HMPREF1982_02944 [Clostridiales bacterium oral taxon 876 str. F0540]